MVLTQSGFCRVADISLHPRQRFTVGVPIETCRMDVLVRPLDMSGASLDRGTWTSIEQPETVAPAVRELSTFGLVPVDEIRLSCRKT